VTPDRLNECLNIIRWSPHALAQSLYIDEATVETWRNGSADIPSNVGSWIEALCFTHEASDLMRPAVVGSGQAVSSDWPQVPEHIPVYSYNLLRALGGGPIPLRSLFGTDDEGAVFFLVSRGLAMREEDRLLITAVGRKIGTILPG
jgi:hypothetical protein